MRVQNDSKHQLSECNANDNNQMTINKSSNCNLPALCEGVAWGQDIMPVPDGV